MGHHVPLFMTLGPDAVFRAPRAHRIASFRVGCRGPRQKRVVHPCVASPRGAVGRDEDVGQAWALQWPSHPLWPWGPQRGGLVAAWRGH